MGDHPLGAHPWTSGTLRGIRHTLHHPRPYVRISTTRGGARSAQASLGMFWVANFDFLSISFISAGVCYKRLAEMRGLYPVRR